ncbi:MAG: PAS domain S-box protein [Deltaproteobacteria bacterium]|nr:PAS domain S-box protein [Deltaproteobacteria bacterium]
MTIYTQEWLSQQIVRKAADAIIFADEEGIIRLWNTGAETIFGYPAEEALGQSLDLIVPEKLRNRHWEGYRKVMATGMTKYGQETLAVPAITKDNNRISIEFTIVLVTNEAGDPLGTAAIVRDVTERFLKQKELKKRLADLEQREKKA